jgi:hypothetical protein
MNDERMSDDALIAVVNGTIFLDFYRDGLSFEDAVESASRNVELAGGKVVRVVPTIRLGVAHPDRS